LGKPSYQLAFVRPGILPSLANWRNWFRQMPNFLMYPRGLPVSLQRLRKRTAEELRGSLSKAAQFPASFKALRLAANFFTNSSFFLVLATIDNFAILYFQ
jgi:hypothetical protein